MRNSKFIKLGLLGFVAAGTAYAGFRDPVESSGGRAKDVEATYVRTYSAPAAKSAAPTTSAAIPKETGRAPASPVQAMYGPTPPQNFQPPHRTSFPFAANPRTQAPAPLSKARPTTPLPVAPGLPAFHQTNVPNLQLPNAAPSVTISRDNRSVIEVNTRNKVQLHNFSRQARMQTLPSRTYTDVVRSAEIASRYAPALAPKPHRTIRTSLHLQIEKTAKITNPPSPIQYENMVKRLDALFAGLDLHYAAGVLSLWQLSVQPNNKPFQARDALFAGILSRRAGWEAAAGNLMEDGAKKRLDKEGRYLGILWKELDAFETTSHIDRVIASVNPLRVKLEAPAGDKANYAMARRLLAGRAHPALSVDTLRDRIGNTSYRERLEMIRALSHLRAKKGDKALALDTLKRLEAEGQEDLREDARLALARAKLQRGETQESLDLYRRVTKTGQNRLAVLGEQSYAEYRAGLPQESLGKAMGLQSPYFQYGFAPDIHIVEILSRKALCDFGGAEAGIQRFQERYGRELNALQQLLAKRTDPKAFYEELIAFHGKADPQRFERFLLNQAKVMENQKVMNAALTELDKIDQLGTRRHMQVARPAGWEEFAAAMRSGWATKAGSLKVESARAALAEVEYMVSRLKQTFGQIELLSLDVATGATKNYNLQSALNFPVRKLASVEVDQEKLHWAFEDEIWEDELDYLKMKNPSKCANTAQNQAVN